jgi:hypothetical protein
MATVITGNQIPAFRIKMLRTGLKSEIRGMRLTSRGRSCYVIVKSEFGFKGSKQKVLDQLEKWIDNNLGQ